MDFRAMTSLARSSVLISDRPAQASETERRLCLLFSLPSEMSSLASCKSKSYDIESTYNLFWAVDEYDTGVATGMTMW